MRPETAVRLAKVANIYREASHQGNPPTQTVADALDVTHTAAAKLVARSREAGLLPPTGQGRGARPAHTPALAVIYRNSKQERRWKVCRTCLVAWPCDTPRGG